MIFYVEGYLERSLAGPGRPSPAGDSSRTDLVSGRVVVNQRAGGQVDGYIVVRSFHGGTVGGGVVFEAELLGIDQDTEVAVVFVVVALEGDGIVGLGLGEHRYGLRGADGALAQAAESVTAVADHEEGYLALADRTGEALIGVRVTR